MSKTLNGGDQILVNRFVYKVTDPKTNDIVVFLPNGNEKSHYYVKRVIGVPGDPVPVSYTHLDVYKRQHQCSWTERMVPIHFLKYVWTERDRCSDHHTRHVCIHEIQQTGI